MDQEKLAELQMLQQQAEVMSQNLQTIEQNISDLNSVINTLDEFSKLKKGDDILVSLSNGVFASAKLEDNEKLKVNVGKNAVVSKTVASTKKMMQSQTDELESYKKDAEEYLTQISGKLDVIHRELIAKGAQKAE